MPGWLRGLLEGPTSSYLALRNGVAALPNWGMLSKVERYCRHDEEAEHLQNQLHHVERQLESEQLVQCQCEGRLEGAHFPSAVHHLRHLNTDPSWTRSPALARPRFLPQVARC